MRANGQRRPGGSARGVQRRAGSARLDQRATASSRGEWEWHPLADAWAARIVGEAGVRPGDLVVDVGAARGGLTRHHVAAGAQVIAVELHAERARVLRQRFASEPVTVVQADAASLRLPRRPLRVVANPPYSISSPLLRRLLAPGSRLLAADLVLQRAVIRKFAEVGHRARDDGCANSRCGTAARCRGLPSGQPLRSTPPILQVRRRR